MISKKKFGTLLSLLFLGSFAVAQHSTTTLASSAEDESVADFAQLPPSALQLLLKDHDDFRDTHAQLQCDRKEVFESDAPNAQILCRKLPLSNRPGANYLVIGVGDLRGAHIVPFWIVHVDTTGSAIIFKTRSDGIEVLKSKSNGYREIESTSVFQAGANIVTTRYRFDGHRYIPISSHEDHN